MLRGLQVETVQVVGIVGTEWQSCARDGEAIAPDNQR
jgi:hypothetical protein